MKNFSNAPREWIDSEDDYTTEINNAKTSVNELVNGIVTVKDFSKLYNIFKNFIENQALSNSEISILKNIFCNEKNIIVRDVLIENILLFRLGEKFLNDFLLEKNWDYNIEDFINYIVNKLDNYPYIILNEKEFKSWKYRIIFDEKWCKIFDEKWSEIEIFREVKSFLFWCDLSDLLHDWNPIFVEYYNWKQAMILLDKTWWAIRNRNSSKINLNPEIYEGEIREVIRWKKIGFSPFSFGTYNDFIKNLKEKWIASFCLNREILLLIWHTNIKAFKKPNLYIEEKWIIKYWLFRSKIKEIKSYSDIVEFLK